MFTFEAYHRARPDAEGYIEYHRSSEECLSSKDLIEQRIYKMGIPKTGKYHIMIESPKCPVVNVWFQNNRIHRDGDMPAVTCKDKCELYYKEGKMHRDDDKPALTYYYDHDSPLSNNISKVERWYINGIFGRINGPAWIDYTKDSNGVDYVYTEHKFHLYGREVSKGEFEKHRKELEAVKTIKNQDSTMMDVLCAFGDL